MSGEKHDDRLGAGEHVSLVGAEVRLFTAANANATAKAFLHSPPEETTWARVRHIEYNLLRTISFITVTVCSADPPLGSSCLRISQADLVPMSTLRVQ